MSRKNNINIGDIMSIGIGAYAKKIAEDDLSKGEDGYEENPV